MSEQKADIARFLKQMGKQYDLASPLHWQYWLQDVPKADVKDIMTHLALEGYVEVDSDFSDLDNPPEIIDDKTMFCIMFAFVGVHTADSASNQIEHLSDWADSCGYSIVNYAVGEVTEQ